MVGRPPTLLACLPITHLPWQYVMDFLAEPLRSVGFGEVQFFEVRLKPETAPLAKGFDAVCIFVSARHGGRG